MASERSETSNRPFPISPALIETIGWVSGVLGLALASAWIVVGGWDHDGGYFLQRGADIARGLRPYIDYQIIYPPLVDVITALAVRCDSSRVFLAIAIPFAWILANCIATGVLTWTITRSRATATLVAALFPLFAVENEGNHVTLEHGVAFFMLLALAAIAGEAAPLTSRRLVLFGVCLGAAILSKQNGAVAFVPAVAILYARRAEVSRKMIGGFVAGLASVPLAILAWLGFNVTAIYRNVVSQLFSYAAAGSTRLPHDGWRWEFIYAPSSALLYVIVIVAGIAVMVFVPRWRLIAGAGLSAALLEALPRFIRDYRHYNINIWPFMVLLLALAAAQPNENRRAAVIAVLLLFAVETNFRQVRNTYPSDSLLFRVFAPAGHVVESVTPRNGAVRQYGAEPIIEFLASRREDRIDKNPRSDVWDGSGMYNNVPPKDVTVVVVDKGQAWVPPLMRDLQRWRFSLIGRVGDRPRISVFRSLDATKP